VYEKLVVVTRRTRLEELITRFNTRGQAKFYIEHAGGDFRQYEIEHDVYQASLAQLHRDLDLGLPRQFLDRGLLPTYTFGERDIVITVGQDGLVANTAKYVGAQPIIAVNPDPERIDGVLIPFTIDAARKTVEATLAGKFRARPITLAEASLADGQKLLAFNDLFIGAASHVSARYRIHAQGVVEAQSSSGVLVSTGAGSTGWLSSVFNMAAGVTRFAGGKPGQPMRMEWEDPRLLFAIREPFVSRHSAASVVAGWIDEREQIVIESTMPSGGVIFSDGIENDFLRFDSGAIASIHPAAVRAQLVTEPKAR
jgi:NAD kinase